jgi:hypothetical protein
MCLNIIADEVEVFGDHNIYDITASKVGNRDWSLLGVIKALI